ncbi:hypothetical protein TCON_2245 [Astathelohania contejeani]|uniref:Uncharacterized protein n=1 Tax=Astathelohania contejeani TaxID=164912 RepID=A0ABQ7HWJ5_9MICR|nr:hypothetical protein TCON_2245 [Thelohania contejeani]
MFLIFGILLASEKNETNPIQNRFPSRTTNSNNNKTQNEKPKNETFGSKDKPYTNKLDDSNTPWNAKQQENKKENTINITLEKEKNEQVPKTRGIYYGSIWDPILDTGKMVTDQKRKIKLIDHYFESHTPENLPEIKTFGDLSLLTANLYKKVPEKTENEIITNSITKIIDNIHPTIFGLQGVSSYLLDKIKDTILKSDHYKITSFDKHAIDSITGQELYLPIIYDEKFVRILKSGYFETNGKKKTLYGSWIKVKDTRMNFQYTVINVDMVSTFTDVISAEIANIVSDITGDKEISNNPVLLVGGIGTVPINLKNLIKENKFINLLEKDKNNAGFSKSTVKDVEGPQRDFIILRDSKNVLELNYARILRNTPHLSDHLLVHAILSIKTEDK